MATSDRQMSPSLASTTSFVAGVLLIVGGGFQSIEALAAIVRDQYLVVAPNYIYTFDLTAWGWIHLLIGLALVAIGICLLLGQGWAQVAGIVVAAISALINFTWLPYSPFWAILVIAVDLLIIWALASTRAQGQRTQAGGFPNAQLTRRRPPHRPRREPSRNWPDGRSSLVRPPVLVVLLAADGVSNY